MPDDATYLDIEDIAWDICVHKDDDLKYRVNSFNLKREDNGNGPMMILSDEKKVKDE